MFWLSRDAKVNIWSWRLGHGYCTFNEAWEAIHVLV